MSHHRHLFTSPRIRTPRVAKPYDHLSKADLWKRLETAKNALNWAGIVAQTAATLAHNFGRGARGEHRRQLLAVRDAVYKARDATR